jgi:cell division protein FtsB
MATTGRSRGPASRPPRRPSGASGTAKAGAPKGGAAKGGSRAGASKAAASRSPRPSTTGGPTTAKVVRRPEPGWRGRVGGAVTNRFLRRGAVLLSIVAFLAVILGSTVAAWVHQRGQIAALQDHVAAQERDVATLRAEQERWSDPAYVEQQARQRLKFVRPGERSYTVLDPAPRPGTPAVVPEVAQPRDVLPWYETVWESTRTADAPGARG